MPRSDYSLIPYEVDEITSWLQDYLNENLPGMVTDALPEIHYKLKYIPSDTSIWLKADEISTNNTNWVLKYSCKFSNTAKIMVFKDSVMRFRCELRRQSAQGTAYIKLVYYDGVNETEIASFGSSSSTYAWFNDDFTIPTAIFTDAGVFRIYMCMSRNDYYAYARNIQISGVPAVSETLNFTVIEDV